MLAGKDLDMLNMKTVLAAGALVLGSTAAHASLLDFTKGSVTIDPADTISGSVGGISYTVVGSGNLNNSESGPGSVGPLVGDTDGLGVVDDEISNLHDGSQSITVTFGQEVTVTGLYFLDLFLANDGSSIETADVSVDGGDPISFEALVTFSDRVGFADYEGLDLVGTEFVFTTEATNDDRGMPDYALAGINLASVPVPAGVLLLGTALAGLGLRRRKG